MQHLEQTHLFSLYPEIKSEIMQETRVYLSQPQHFCESQNPIYTSEWWLWASPLLCHQFLYVKENSGVEILQKKKKKD